MNAGPSHNLIPFAGEIVGSTDEQLAVGARRGSRDCFEELARRFQVRLLRFLQQRVASHADAEDLLQDTFVRAFERLDQYQEGRPFAAWLFAIAHRLSMSHHRHRKAGERATDAVRRNTNASHVADPGASMAESECRSQFWNIAEAALSPEQLCATWLFYVEQMPAPQIAEVLGRSWVSVKTILFRARRKLEIVLRDGDGSAEPMPIASRGSDDAFSIASILADGVAKRACKAGGIARLKY